MGRTWKHTAGTPASTPDGTAGAPAPPVVIAGRYVIDDKLGHGGFGEVWTATDRVTGEPVAVKIVPALSEAQLSAVRREVNALRWARLPGVVRMRDEGMHGGSWYIVMDRVAGRPFPGLPMPARWEDLRATAWSLLGALATVHTAGVLHLDLKPENVLVGPGGAVTLLDFGLARGPALEVRAPSGGAVALTPQFAAPEQIRQAACDARTDLYSAGLLLYEALAAGLPQHGTAGEIMRDRVGRDAAPLVEAAPGVPPSIARLVDRMLERDPSRRPASAVEVWQAMGGTPPPLLGPGAPAMRWPEPLTEDAVRSLFAGPDDFLHLREDAAQLLWRRGGGQPAAMERELAHWLTTGVSHWRDGKLVITRAALDRLRAQGTSLSLTEVSDLDALRAQLDTLMLAERHRAAGPLLERALATARAHDDPHAELEVLAHLAVAALAKETRSALEPVLFELGRATHRTPEVEHLERLVRAARAVRGHSVEQAAELLAGVPELQDEALETYRAVLRFEIARARGVDAEEQTLAELEGWAGDDDRRRGKLLGWLGNVRYQQSRFEEAADLHTRSAALKHTPIERTGARINAAAALLEALRFEQAYTLARTAKQDAQDARHPYYEALALWLERSTAYRMGVPTRARPFLVDAARPVGAWTEGLFAINEAAIALRGGDRPLAGSLAARAAQCFVGADETAQRLLAEALCLAADDDPHATTISDLEARALECAVPDLCVQVLGLLNRVAYSADRRELALRHAACRPRSQWGARLDVLSFAESTADPPAADPGAPHALDP